MLKVYLLLRLIYGIINHEGQPKRGERGCWVFRAYIYGTCVIYRIYPWKGMNCDLRK